MDKTKQSKGFVARFASYYRPHMPLFILDMVCALAISLVDLIFPLLSRYSMQELLPENLYQAFFALMAILAGAYLLKMALTFVVCYWGHMLGVAIEADIRSDLFAHIQTLSFSFYTKSRTGQLMSRVTSDLFEISELAHHGPEDIFISGVTLLGAFCVMLTIRWELALLIFALVPLFILFTMYRRKKMMTTSVAVKARVAGINGELESAISGIRTAKAFANEEVEHQKFEASNDQFREAKKGWYREMATYFSGMELFMGILPVLVICAGGYFIMDGSMDYIDLITFTLYVSTFTTPIRKLANFSELFLQGSAGFQRFLDLMAVQPEIQDAPDAQSRDSVTGDIQIQNISFFYEKEEGEVLSQVSLHVTPGETVAVVGPSGGGKSTLCQLIPRFYDVNEGAILVDDLDVRQWQQNSLRRHIGIVQQDVFLFAGSIEDNIRYGRPGATFAEVEEAAKKAEIYDDIMAMPKGFQTYVGERGVTLSGGQKQRVSIARVFLKNPSILILDEATSALDSVTEYRIQGAFDQLAQGRTTLIIAHRLSTIRSADRIIVIDHNKILEEGSHQALLEQNGAYAELYKAQQVQ